MNVQHTMETKRYIEILWRNKYKEHRIHLTNMSDLMKTFQKTYITKIYKITLCMYTHTHVHTHFYSLSLSHSHSLSLTYSHSLSLTQTCTNTHVNVDMHKSARARKFTHAYTYMTNFNRSVITIPF